MDTIKAIPPEAARELIQKSMAHVAAPSGTTALIEKVMRWFLNEFIPEPDDYKNQWTFPHKKRAEEKGWVVEGGHVPDAYGDWGYQDEKVYLHYYADLPRRLRERGVDVSRHQEWLDDCARLYRINRELVHACVAGLDRELPGCNLTKLLGLESWGDDCVLRLLAYPKWRADKQHETGRGHWDRDGLTLALWESGPGLRGGLDENDDRHPPIGSLPDRPLLFAGRMLEQITGGKIQALRHSIAPPRGSRYHEQAIRAAVIFFAHPDGVELALPTH